LAASGRLFKNHYVAVPTCGASRYALMTGYKPTTATDGNGAFGRMSGTYPSEPESWVDLLRRNGWYTVSMGKLSHEPDGYRWSYLDHTITGAIRRTLRICLFLGMRLSGITENGGDLVPTFCLC
ncbi:hypothetical protein ACFPTZ_25970, partial [Rubritalea tangerina]